jgi:hypothetical protein
MINAWLGLPDWLIILVLAGGYGLSGWLCVALTHARRWRETVMSYHGVVAPFFVSSSTLFALMTALLGASAHENVIRAAQAVAAEREGAQQIITLAEALPPTDEIVRLPNLVRTYVRAVLSHEWGLDRGNHHSPVVDSALRDLVAAITALRLREVAGQSVQDALLLASRQIAAARLTRLSLAEPVLDPLRWSAVLWLGLLTQLSIAAIHLDKKRPQILAILLSTLASIAAIGTIALSEYPFDGYLAISPAPLAHIARFSGQ